MGMGMGMDMDTDMDIGMDMGMPYTHALRTLHTSACNYIALHVQLVALRYVELHDLQCNPPSLQGSRCLEGAPKRLQVGFQHMGLLDTLDY